ncbi:hypothetical protein HPB48_009040 [Haemaphysalis longicornis]|uniref:Uncharacterized protein n=1 Tax=Haemaphysalis longicornis TaxID=44386 RepID=A0A9J6H414_HAELO|nr:hypothetical protein HPB48_009040 [Haemaphysalis longicornis]
MFPSCPAPTSATPADSRPEGLFRKKTKQKVARDSAAVRLATVARAVWNAAAYSYQQQHRDTTVALHHIFLSGWDSVREIANYPPAAGPYAVYTKFEFYKHVDYVVRQYSNVTTANHRLLRTYYRKGYVWPFNETLIFDNYPIRRCLPIDGPEAGSPALAQF